MGAGVDYLFGPGMTPPKAPVVCLVDRAMSERMASYVLAAVLYHQRQLGRYREQQRERLWRQMMHPDTADVRIGVMGSGPWGARARRCSRGSATTSPPGPAGRAQLQASAALPAATTWASS